MESVVCPECSYKYPPGTVIVAGEGVLDPLVESGGRSGHPEHCSRSESRRSPSLGMFQQSPSQFGRPE